MVLRVWGYSALAVYGITNKNGFPNVPNNFKWPVTGAKVVSPTEPT